MPEVDWIAPLQAHGATVLDRAEGEARALDPIARDHPWSGILDPIARFEDARGRPVCLVRAGPLVGYLVAFGPTRPFVVARSLAAYVEAVRRQGGLPEESLLDGPRTDREELGAQHLVANAFDEHDVGALKLAIPLIQRNLGLLVALATEPAVATLATERLLEVTTPEQRVVFDQTGAPAPWPVPVDVLPRVEEELDGWTRTQTGFAGAVIVGELLVSRGEVRRVLRLPDPVDLVQVLDAALPGDPDDLGFLAPWGAWSAAIGEPVAELRWFGSDHVRLTVGEALYDWTRDP